jgi:hypothetical protein
MLLNLSKAKESILILRQMVLGGDNLQAEFFYSLLIGPMLKSLIETRARVPRIILYQVRFGCLTTLLSRNRKGSGQY